jgi:hypothetical protein
MSLYVDGINGLTFPDGSAQPTSGYTGFRNRIINGAMVIDQRNSGASLTPTVDNTYTVDRWAARLSQASKYSVQQNAGSVTPPPGYTNYLGVTSLSAYSLLSTDYFVVVQYIEGYNIYDLAWGSANAKTVTLGFWVYSSLTGTFSGVLENSSVSRSYTFTYTITSANTWTYITITVPGDVTGTWLTTTGIGMRVYFSLGVGSSRSQTAGAWTGAESFGNSSAVSVVGTSGATFYITGVQLEKAGTATPFEFRPYGTELALCQRYYYRNTYVAASGSQTMAVGAVNGATSAAQITAVNPVTMRAAPTVGYSGVSVYDGSVINGVTSISVQSSGTVAASFNVGTNSAGGSLTTGRAAMIIASSSGNYLDFTAEL